MSDRPLLSVSRDRAAQLAGHYRAQVESSALVPVGFDYAQPTGTSVERDGGRVLSVTEAEC